jgi:hypothetical protein
MFAGHTAGKHSSGKRVKVFNALGADVWGALPELAVKLTPNVASGIAVKFPSRQKATCRKRICQQR